MQRASSSQTEGGRPSADKTAAAASRRKPGTKELVGGRGGKASVDPVRLRGVLQKHTKNQCKRGRSRVASSATSNESIFLPQSFAAWYSWARQDHTAKLSAIDSSRLEQDGRTCAVAGDSGRSAWMPELCTHSRSVDKTFCPRVKLGERKAVAQHMWVRNHYVARNGAQKVNGYP